jgi:hypothetical protein
MIIMLNAGAAYYIIITSELQIINIVSMILKI